MPQSLARLLDREQERVTLAWASTLAQLRASAFVHRPVEELRRLGRAYLAALVQYLDTGDPARLQEFVRREAAMRLAMGFTAAEVVQGFTAFRELAQELCVRPVASESERLELTDRLSRATDYAIVEFVTHYQQLAEQREVTHRRELEQLQRALAGQSVVDEVTDLFTDRFFDAHLPVEVRRAARYGHAVTVVVLEIDQFEARHARYGPMVAQAALRAVARVLREGTRESDVKARTGETEFSVVLPETGAGAGYVVADRIRMRVSALPAPGLEMAAGSGEPATVSVGVATYPEHATTAEALMRTAREARDTARLLGGDTVVQAATVGRGDPPPPR